MKRVTMLIMAMLLVFSCIPGMAEGTNGDVWFGNADGTPVTLKVWGGVQPEYGYNAIVENFNREYLDKGIQIEYVRYVNNTDGNLQVDTYLMSGGEIDVLIGYGAQNLINRANSNLILNLTDRLNAYGFDCVKELGDASMSQYWINGDQIYGFPTIYSNNRWMLVNVDYFNEAGIAIPYEGWTYAQFLDAAEKLTKGSGYDKVHGMMWAFYQDTAQARGLVSSILGQTAIYVDAEGTASNFNHPVWVEGLELIKKTMDNGWAYGLDDEKADSLTVANTYLEGKCAMSMNISQLRLIIDTEAYPHEFKTALVPGPVPSEEYLTDEYKYHTNYSGTNDLCCIPHDSKNPDAAFEFIMWYVKGGMSPLAEYGRIPLWSGFDSSLIINSLANKGDVLDLASLENYLNVDKSVALVAPKLSAYNQIDAVIVEEFENVLFGQKSVEDGLNSAKTRADELIKLAK